MGPLLFCLYMGVDHLLEQVVNQAFTLSDSVFLVLLIALAGGTWWIIRYVFNKNDEREKRYIDVIDTQAKGLLKIDGIREDIEDIKHIVMRGK